MELYVIRHADALPVGQDGVGSDEERPLSEAGRAVCRPLAEALQRQHAHLAKVVTSPLLRAKQTAEGLLEHWPAPAPELVVCNALRPGGKRRKLTRFLRSFDAEALAVVGHNPDLSTYLAWLLGAKDAQIELAKAGVARVDLEGGPGKGGGVLNWMVTPEWYGALQIVRG
jgi:phosphohistidine phosphatase